MDTESQKDYLILLRAMADTSEAMKGMPTGDDGRLLDLEGLYLKGYYHGSAILYLSRGTAIPELFQSFIDPASVPVLTRALLESSLTVNYVFRQPKDEQELKLRHNAWRLAGMLDRHRYVPLTACGRQKLADERSFIDRLICELQSNPQWMEYPEKIRKTVVKNREWRLPVRTSKGKYNWPGWRDLAEEAGLGKRHSQDVYHFLCGYSHSSYSSAFQIHQAKTPNQRRELCDATWDVAKIALALMIRDFAALLEPAQSILRRHQEYIDAIDLWLYIGSDPIPDEDID